MNTKSSKIRSSSTRSLVLRRAQFSPVFPRPAQEAVIRSRLHAQSAERSNVIVPDAETLTPGTPVFTDRFWNPHLVDRLQTQLTRFRD